MGLAILVSLLAGVTIVLSRTVNARLANATGPVQSTVYNYLTGLAGSAVMWVVVWLAGGGVAAPAVQPPAWAFTGGIIGVVVVMLSNMTVAKISSFYMTLLLFLGQMGAGLVLDAAMGRPISAGMLLGCAAVAAGLCINVFADKPAGRRPVAGE